MTKKYREGTAGALMNEYERAVGEFEGVLKKTDQGSFVKIADPDTKDPNCRSINHHESCYRSKDMATQTIFVNNSETNG